MAKDIVDIAIGEIGYKESGDNLTKYGKWFGMNGVAWCHMFESWCATKANEKSNVPQTASTTTGMQWFKNKNKFKYKGKYTPKRGDIMYLKSSGASHVAIVEYVKGSNVHTVEGNYNNKVTRVTRALTNKQITGYGVPSYSNLNSSSTTSSTTTSTTKTSDTELAYLKKILNNKSSSSSTTISATVNETNKLPSANVKLIITNSKSEKFTVPVQDDLKIVWERKGTPGKVTFNAKYESGFKIEEGNAVAIYINNNKFFYGFVFTKQMSKDKVISYTAYDQLRYFKNKDTFIYKKKTASEVVKLIGSRFSLNCGKLADTKYKMSAVEDNIELFEIIQNALDETLMTKEKLYVLYDEFGKIRLSNVSDMKVNSCLIDEETAEDYTYKSSIDEETYNQIKLVYENKDKGTYDLYVAKSSKNINKWGVLQYLEKIDDPDVGKLKSQAYLKLYNKKTKSLSISGVIGNTSVRAGSLVPVVLNLLDVKIANYMLVEKVTHTFKNNQYTMDLILSGGDFSG
jgi:hypothetical protein